MNNYDRTLKTIRNLSQRRSKDQVEMTLAQRTRERIMNERNKVQIPLQLSENPEFRSEQYYFRFHFSSKVWVKT